MYSKMAFSKFFPTKILNGAVNTSLKRYFFLNARLIIYLTKAQHTHKTAYSLIYILNMYRMHCFPLNNQKKLSCIFRYGRKVSLLDFCIPVRN